MMQAIILAAGKGVRMGKICETTPKPMLKILGKNLIQHKIDILPSEINEVILVIGYLGDQIKNFFGVEYNGRKIKYVEQLDQLNGTAAALFAAKDLLKDNFISMMGDDLYGQQDIKNALNYKNVILAKEVKEKSPGGKITLDENDHLMTILDDREGKVEGGLIDTGLYVLSTDIFKYKPVQLPNSKEFGLPQTILAMSKDVEVKVVRANTWQKITIPEDLAIAEKIFR